MLGAKVTAISDELGISRHQVRYILASPLAVKLRQELQKQRDERTVDIAARIAEMCPDSLDVLNKTLKGEDDQATLAMRVKVAESILDRAGYSKVINTRNLNIGTQLTADDIETLKQRAKENAFKKGIVDVTPCEG